MSEPEVTKAVQNAQPFEVLSSDRYRILSSLNLNQLSTLLQGSSVLRDDYIRHRESLFPKSIEKTLRSVLPEACAVHRSCTPNFSKTRTNKTVEDLLSSYKSWYFSKEYSIVHAGLAENEMLEIATFYQTTVNPLMQIYIQWLSTNGIFKTTLNFEKDIILSSVEEIRVLRAFYRFQLGCNLFGNGALRDDVQSNSNARIRFKPIDILESFLCIYEPWEVEEILCVNAFVTERYDEVFGQIQMDVHPENPKFADQNRPPTPDGAFHLDESYTRAILLSGTISRGLQLLHSTFTQSHTDLVSIMQKNMCYPPGPFLENDKTLGLLVQRRRQKQQPLDRDRRQQLRDPLPFRGDFEEDQLGVYPSKAWTLIWGGTYSNIYGYCIPENLRRWGYIFWDSSRLAEMGGEKMILEEWQRVWKTGDPRNYFGEG